MEKQERKERKILTDNRMMTVNKRECSFEGLVSQLENGEDGIYNLITDNKQIIFQPKISITKKDLEEITVFKIVKRKHKSMGNKIKANRRKRSLYYKKSFNRNAERPIFN